MIDVHDYYMIFSIYIYQLFINNVSSKKMTKGLTLADQYFYPEEVRPWNLDQNKADCILIWNISINHFDLAHNSTSFNQACLIESHLAMTG